MQCFTASQANVDVPQLAARQLREREHMHVSHLRLVLRWLGLRLLVHWSATLLTPLPMLRRSTQRPQARGAHAPPAAAAPAPPPVAAQRLARRQACPLCRARRARDLDAVCTRVTLQ